MGKAVKAKKHDTFIDMTAMSDVTVLLLTFFMLTATFLPKEPVQVISPRSVSETKVPENNVLTILIDGEGKVFLNFDEHTKATRKDIEVLDLVGKDYGLTFSDGQKRSFNEQTHVGVPIGRLSDFLNKSITDQDEEIKKYGVPLDSANNQFERWIKRAREVNGDGMQIAIKAGETTPYPLVEAVMKNLVKMKENRYNLVTSLKAAPNID
ncbi:biopolymer transporter ExbD [Dysgonomonas sp. Marseille-P4361]|uniref:ExbD/TolR family protein n=1 Tax=Dysgonomonas sp. Marseille-P4361 TaxID=2161820 RepID=UPI000D555736|nr:biopolymer transporter ExbD [Dysgonomonas sp. Marseille-P4361]